MKKTLLFSLDHLKFIEIIQRIFMQITLILILLFVGNNLFGQCAICSSLEEALKEPAKVEVLRLNNNHLKKYPEKIKQFFNLRELELSNYEDYSMDDEGSENIINTIPSVISDLNKLKILKLERVNLESIPEEIGLLKNLEVLYLGNNEHLTKTPSNIGELSNLKELHLNNIGLDSIPEWISDLENLEILYLNGNNISYLPSNLVKLKKLKVLGLSRNKLGIKLTIPAFDIGDEVIDTINSKTGKIIEIYENSFIVEGWNDYGDPVKLSFNKEFTNWAYGAPCPVELEVLYKINWYNIETIDLQFNDVKINNYLNGDWNGLEDHILTQRNPQLFTLQLFFPNEE
jgi:hypothetical protein